MIPRTSVGDGLDRIFVVGRNSFRSLQFDKFAVSPPSLVLLRKRGVEEKVVSF